MEKVILHADLNNFYASVELLLNPSLKGKPLIVCGDPQKRHGIVLAKSNEAKKCGAVTGEAIWQAKQKCGPDLICVPPRHHLYGEISKKVFSIYTEYTDKVESFGLDECWLDVTHSQKLFGNGKQIADKLRDRIKNELGLTISVGVSFNKIFAKLGSDLKKPDATTVISRENFKSIVHPLPASDLLMVGKKTNERLARLNIHTIGDLANADINFIKKSLGVVGEQLVLYARGEDNSEVGIYNEHTPPLSIGHGSTLPIDAPSIEVLTPVVYALSDMVGARLRKHEMLANGLQVSIKDDEFNSFSRQITLPNPTDSSATISRNALEIIKSFYDFNHSRPVRTVTISAIRLSGKDEGVQLSIFGAENEKNSALDKTLDKIREKYGYKSVSRGIVLSNSFLCDNLNFDE